MQGSAKLVGDVRTTRPDPTPLGILSFQLLRHVYEPSHVDIDTNLGGPSHMFGHTGVLADPVAGATIPRDRGRSVARREAGAVSLAGPRRLAHR
jgi:hypothetical protein